MEIFASLERGKQVELSIIVYTRQKWRPVVVQTMLNGLVLGAIHKGRPQPRGEGGLVKSGHLRTQGGGGSVAKSGHPQIQIFTKILEV